ncbi:MAG: CRISPR-associated protein Cas5 [Candidatus ainarchaeum sp.]|nr:CRISPR-associated protein Cas5 [Candidatus ainarchaeum sp.]
MKKILKFSLSGKFGHFKFPFTSPNHLKKTYSIPPRTTLLGILGAIIGLKGFQDYDSGLPEYYEKLNHIPISIVLTDFPKRYLIKYNSLNSFANNSKDVSPNMIISEELLLNPNYEILLILDDINEIDKTLLSAFDSNQVKSTFPIYLGKNEFFAEITNIEIFDFSEKFVESCESSMNLKSIIPSKFIDYRKDLSEEVSNGVLDSFSYDIDFSDMKLKTKFIEVFYFLKDLQLRDSIKFKNKLNLIKLNGEKYFFFDYGVIRNLQN